MSLTPLAHPLGVSGATEVILVLGFCEPSLLAASFAGLPTTLLLAEFLVMAITGIGNENLPAAQAFHRGARKSSTACALQINLFPFSSHRLAEEDSPRRRKKRFRGRCPRKRPTRKPHLQIGAFTPFSVRRAQELASINHL
jgi:hypothetical protein